MADRFMIVPSDRDLLGSMMSRLAQVEQQLKNAQTQLLEKVIIYLINFICPLNKIISSAVFCVNNYKIIITMSNMVSINKKRRTYKALHVIANR